MLIFGVPILDFISKDVLLFWSFYFLKQEQMQIKIGGSLLIKR